MTHLNEMFAHEMGVQQLIAERHALARQWSLARLAKETPAPALRGTSSAGTPAGRVLHPWARLRKLVGTWLPARPSPGRQLRIAEHHGTGGGLGNAVRGHPQRRLPVVEPANTTSRRNVDRLTCLASQARVPL